MKKFTKLFLSCAAIAALSTAIGVSAMAADITGDVKGTFDETAKTVTINTETSNITPDNGTQVTFLVFKGKVDTDISSTTVKGIDQGTTVQPANNGLMSDVEAPESGQDIYTVKVGYYDGGTFTVKSGTFKLGEADIDYGDITDLAGTYVPDGKKNTADALAILKYANKDATAQEKIVGDLFTAADVATFGAPATEAGDGKVNTADSLAILRFANKQTTDIGLLKQYVAAN